MTVMEWCVSGANDLRFISRGIWDPVSPNIIFSSDTCKGALLVSFCFSVSVLSVSLSLSLSLSVSPNLDTSVEKTTMSIIMSGTFHTHNFVFNNSLLNNQSCPRIIYIYIYIYIYIIM